MMAEHILTGRSARAPSCLRFPAASAWLCLASALAGCAAAPPAPNDVAALPVQVPCVQQWPPRPVYDFATMSVDDSDGAKVLALTRDWIKARKYELALEAALAGCLSAEPNS